MWMGTQLLWFDVLVSINHTIKQLRGEKVTKRERKKMARTLADIAKLIPLTTLMLINISASKFVSHQYCIFFRGFSHIEKYFSCLFLMESSSLSPYFRPTKPQYKRNCVVSERVIRVTHEHPYWVCLML